jgi:ABC-type nitrate/sulfonate/bicarbonate transport system permease component
VNCLFPRQIILSVATVLTPAIFGMVIFGYLWCLIADLRFCDAAALNSPASVLPELNCSLSSLIDCYNTIFSGSARFGSGFGLIAGVFYGLSRLGECALAARIAAFGTAGSIIGGRLCLMGTSDADLFLICSSISCILMSLAAALMNIHSRSPLELELDDNAVEMHRKLAESLEQ